MSIRVTHVPTTAAGVPAFLKSERAQAERLAGAMGAESAEVFMLQLLGYVGGDLTELWADVERTKGLGNVVSAGLLSEREVGS